MNFKPSTVAIAAACLCVFGHSAYADEGPTWKFSGFGTVGVAHSNNDQADFVGNSNQPNGTGHTRYWAGSTDSKLGAQLDAKFSPQWSASVQLLSQLNTSNNYNPVLSLGFLKFTPTSGVDLRAGRLPYSAFMISDYRNIGYSQPWIRPPLELYSLGAPHTDGVDVTWRTSVGPVGVKTQAIYGQATQESLNNGKVKTKGVFGVNVTGDIGDFTARASLLSVRSVTVEDARLDSTFAIVRSGLPAGALGPGAPALPGDPAAADEFAIKDKKGQYLSLGATYDPGTWFVTGEFGQIKQIGFTSTAREFYLTGGVRVKAFTPYLSVAGFKQKNDLTSTNPIVRGIIVSSNARDQKSISAGTRWDFDKSAALKVQYDRISLADGSTGFFANVQPAFERGGRTNVISAAVDFVF
ncbi:MAG: hypothetical protein RLZZ618_2973 [Pseudomonadota bacterium]|jgi:hypothetical protein